MHNTDQQYIRSYINQIFTSYMHNLKTYFVKLFNITELVFKDRLNKADNFYFYPHKPKLSDCEIIALSVTDESIGIDSENYFQGKLKSDHKDNFSPLIHRGNFIRRRERLYPFIEEINKSEDIYLVDSIPVLVCRIAREKQSKICKDDFETAPDKGYSAVSKSYYHGYKFRQVNSVRGFFHSMDLTWASVLDVHYLSEIKNSSLSICTLIADNGYLSSTYQFDLFNSCQVSLQTPKRANQERMLYPIIFIRVRKRIETLFSQLCDQFMLKCYYAKTNPGLSVRILSKIKVVTLLQYINSKNNKPLNYLKSALAS